MKEEFANALFSGLTKTLQIKILIRRICRRVSCNEAILTQAQSAGSEIQLRNWKFFPPLKYAILSFEKCLSY